MSEVSNAYRGIFLTQAGFALNISLSYRPFKSNLGLMVLASVVLGLEVLASM